MSSTVAEISKYSSKNKPKPIASQYFQIKEDVKIVKGKDGKDSDPSIVASLIKEDVTRDLMQKLMRNKDFLEVVRGLPGKDGEPGNIKDLSPEVIAYKLNSLKEAIDVAVIKGLESAKEKEVVKESVDITDIVEKVISSIKSSKRLDVKDITGVPQKSSKGLNFNDQRWHGSGVTSLTAGTGISITTGTDGGYIISATAVSAGYQSPTGTVNGVNQTFIFATAPNAILVDGLVINKTQSDGTINWTGTTAVVLTVAPNFNIAGIS